MAFEITGRAARWLFRLAAILLAAPALAADLPRDPLLMIDSGGHTALVRSLLFTKDGARIVSARGQDRTPDIRACGQWRVRQGLCAGAVAGREMAGGGERGAALLRRRRLHRHAALRFRQRQGRASLPRLRSQHDHGARFFARRPQDSLGRPGWRGSPLGCRRRQAAAQIRRPRRRRLWRTLPVGRKAHRDRIRRHDGADLEPRDWRDASHFRSGLRHRPAHGDIASRRARAPAASTCGASRPASGFAKSDRWRTSSARSPSIPAASS